MIALLMVGPWTHGGTLFLSKLVPLAEVAVHPLRRPPAHAPPGWGGGRLGTTKGRTEYLQQEKEGEKHNQNPVGKGEESQNRSAK